MKELSPHLRFVLRKMLTDLADKLPDSVSAVVLFSFFLIIGWAVRRTMRSAFHRAHLESNIARMLIRLVHYAIVALGLVEALTQLKVNLTALGLGVGLLSFGIGFALKDILSNFLAGILIIWTRPFVNGDQIRIRDYEGTVEAIEMRGTILKTYDGRRVIIPNADVYTNPVVNNTYYPLRRSSLSISVGYGTNLTQVEAVIREALRAAPDVAAEPPPDVLIRNLGSYAIELEVRIWTPVRQIEMLAVGSAATKAIKEAFDVHAIEIPFPTQVSITAKQDGDAGKRSQD